MIAETKSDSEVHSIAPLEGPFTEKLEGADQAGVETRSDLGELDQTDAPLDISESAAVEPVAALELEPLPEPEDTVLSDEVEATPPVYVSGPILTDPDSSVLVARESFTLRFSQFHVPPETLEAQVLYLDKSDFSERKWTVLQDYTPLLELRLKFESPSETALQVNLRSLDQGVQEVWVGSFTVVDPWSVSHFPDLMGALLLSASPFAKLNEQIHFISDNLKMVLALLSGKAAKIGVDGYYEDNGSSIDMRLNSASMHYDCENDLLRIDGHPVILSLESFEAYRKLRDHFLNQPSFHIDVATQLAGLSIAIRRHFRYSPSASLGLRSLNQDTAHCGSYASAAFLILQAWGYTPELVIVQEDCGAIHALVAVSHAGQNYIIDPTYCTLHLRDIEAEPEGLAITYSCHSMFMEMDNPYTAERLAQVDRVYFHKNLTPISLNLH